MSGLDGQDLPAQLAILLPVLGGVLSLLLIRRSGRLTALLVLTAGLLGLASAVALLVQQTTGHLTTTPGTVGPLPLGGDLVVPLRLYADSWSVLVAVAVALVSFVVQAFARWYLWTDPRYRQFAATVGLFTGAMQLVVLSGDLLLTLVGWELMGWCSYLLIGHHSEKEKARRAAYKSFIVTRLADAPFVVGIAALAYGAHSTSIADVIAFWTREPLAHSLTLSGAMISLICGVLGKSAQLPFQDWLPDAMEGPTPASALIHAATMVAAGTVVLARLQPLLAEARHARLVLVLLAGTTMVLAALLAFAQQDLKRLLAWSTVSQVGIMLVALASLPLHSGPETAILQLLSHAMFKALLFLMFGWITVLVGGTVAPRMAGSIRRHSQTHTLTAIGLLALAGVPPLSGFVSKDLVIDSAARQAADGGRVALIGVVLLGITTVLTAAYCMRAWLVLQHRTGIERRTAVYAVEDSYSVEEVGLVELLRDSPQVDEWGQVVEPEVPEGVVEEEPEPGSIAYLGLGTLALLSVVGGALAGSPMLHIQWRHLDWMLVGAFLLLMLAAALLVRVMSLGTVYGDAADRLPMSLRLRASRGMDVDAVYVALVARPVLALAHGVAGLDARLDRAVEGTAGVAARVADRSERLHTRRPSTGLLAVAGGVLVVAVLGVTWW